MSPRGRGPQENRQRGDTAADRLARILALLPLASREDGIAYDELAERVGATRDQVIRDIQAVADRDTYHPVGGADDIQVIAIESDRVRVRTTGEFDRPVRLNLREAAALELGLRAIAAERGLTDRAAELAARLSDVLAWSSPEATTNIVSVQPDSLAADEIRASIVECARARRCCRFTYLKPGSAPEPRTVDVYTVAYAAGLGYAIGYCHTRQDMRVFRIDRILDIEHLEREFTVPADFRPSEYLHEGSIFAGSDDLDVEVEVRSTHDDDSVVARYHAADVAWIVRRVLRHGRTARLVRPPELRQHVFAAASRAAEP